MKTSQYFQHTRLRPDRAIIKDEWIIQVMEKASRREVQSDGRIRLWGKITEAGDKFLRVVLLEDHETVHNAFFDRNMKENKS